MSGTAFEAARHELPGLQAQMEQYLQMRAANLNNAMALSAYNREIARLAMRDITLFTQVGALRLRSYQCDVARAVLRSVFTGAGDSLVVVLPRQSGKNELQAHIEAMLLLLYSESKGEMVKISPTWKPQSQNAMHRLERVLSANLLTRNRWEKHAGYIYSIGTARLVFLSGSPESNIVGATASTLLEVDEAQSVLPAKFDRDIAPMAASTNATRVFWGTAWSSQTLLARELRLARQAQLQDGRQRVFVLSAEQVAAEVPAYGAFVSGIVASLGRQHPLVKTQYFSEEIDGESGMFSAQRLALMQGDHPRQRSALRGRIYAMLLDVAGEDESARSGQPVSAQLPENNLKNPGRDSTALTILEVDLSGLDDPALQNPIYRVVERIGWQGTPHADLHARLKTLADAWQARYVVVDATGVGTGLASFLQKSLHRRLIPFIFSSASKSRMAWDFLALLETGRFKDWDASLPPIYGPVRPAPEFEQLNVFKAGAFQGLGVQDLQALFFRQCAACQMEVLPGVERRVRWGVPDGVRDPATNDLLHDDWLMSAALCSLLDRQSWGTASSEMLRPRDPLEGMRPVY